jgi:hypothetical protein
LLRRVGVEIRAETPQMEKAEKDLVLLARVSVGPVVRKTEVVCHWLVLRANTITAGRRREGITPSTPSDGRCGMRMNNALRSVRKAVDALISGAFGGIQLGYVSHSSLFRAVMFVN